VRDWIQIRVLHRHNKITLYTPNFFWSKNKIAVFAVYPGTTTIASNLRILKALLETHHDVLVVFNKNALMNQWIDEFKQYPCMIISRPNIGRDFGAYQAGIRYISKSLKEEFMQKLVLVNDTCYVSPKIYKKFLLDFFNQDEFNCIFKHHQSVVHAASSLIVLDKVKISSLEFKNFWKRYYPANTRIKVIFKGEHELTRILGPSYFKPATDGLKNLGSGLQVDEIIQMRLWIQRSLPDFNAIDQYRTNRLEPQYLNLKVNFCRENLQVSNTLGLYLTRKFHFPLKLDLPYQQLTTSSSILDRLSAGGCENDELNQISSILREKGNIFMGTPYERILKRFGIIT
jgi:hypothetical protein